jgi:hypothetical protein
MIGFREAQVMVLVAVTSALGCEAFQNELQKLQVRGERTELKGLIDTAKPLYPAPYQPNP